MGDDRRARIMQQLQRLREVMDEDEIFDQTPDGRIYFSQKAARQLAKFAAEDAEAWFEKHKPAAAEAAASMLAQYQKQEQNQ